MPIQKVNWAAVVVAGIVFWLWGAVWFSILKNPWIAAVGFTPAQVANKDPVPYVISFIMALILALGTAIALADSDQPTARHGIEFGLFMGIVIFVTNALSINLFEMKPYSLWLIDSGYVVIGMILVGAIVGGWRKTT